ncbi:MAG: glycosyltransferase [Elusimicrobia bacterium]|nr:glycosyltransferase [Elusimicrobiota bacterium]
MVEAEWRPDAGLCVPVLDERDSLATLLDEIAGRLAGGDYTVCVIDDGSTDGTKEFVRGYGARNKRVVLIERKRQGSGCRRGGATRAGLEWLLANTRHRVIVDFDADGSNMASELAGGIRRVACLGADVAIASKYAPGSQVLERPLGRRLGSRAYNLLLRLLMDPAIRDYSNSYRFYSREAAELLLRYPAGYESPVYLVEMLAIWLAHGLKVVELPTVYGSRRGGASKVVPTDFARGLFGALAVGLAYRSGRYR